MHGYKPIVVVIPSYNNRNWYEKNLNSVFLQNYPNYRVIYIDDCSTDGTSEGVKNYLQKKSKKNNITYIRNPRRLGALQNFYNTVHNLTRDEEIVVILDGDDWLGHKSVLSEINEFYTKKGVWLTHGKLMEWPQGTVAWSIPIPPEIVKENKFREYRCPSHLKTFYSWLFKLIKKEDLFYKGEFCPMTGDMAIMFPMIEMAGERHGFIKEVNYIYNIANVLNDNKVDPTLQREIDYYIRNLPRYQRLPKGYFD